MSYDYTDHFSRTVEFCYRTYRDSKSLVPLIVLLKDGEIKSVLPISPELLSSKEMKGKVLLPSIKEAAKEVEADCVIFMHECWIGKPRIGETHDEAMQRSVSEESDKDEGIMIYLECPDYTLARIYKIIDDKHTLEPMGDAIDSRETPGSRPEGMLTGFFS